MTPKESHACGLKSWAFGYATLTREKYKFLAPDTTAPQQGSAASGRQPLNMVIFQCCSLLWKSCCPNICPRCKSSKSIKIIFKNRQIYHACPFGPMQCIPSIGMTHPASLTQDTTGGALPAPQDAKGKRPHAKPNLASVPVQTPGSVISAFKKVLVKKTVVWLSSKGICANHYSPEACTETENQKVPKRQDLRGASAVTHERTSKMQIIFGHQRHFKMLEFKRRMFEEKQLSDLFHVSSLWAPDLCGSFPDPLAFSKEVLFPLSSLLS